MATTTWIFTLAIVVCSGLASAQDNHNHDHDGIDHYNDVIVNSTALTKPQQSLTQAYLYGTLAVAVVSALSLAGVIVIPFIKRKVLYDSTMLLFMGLAVGTMASDALLHLIPETMGLHGHSSEKHNLSEEASHEHQADKPYLGKMVALLGTLYALYLLELFAHVFSKVVKTLVSVGDSSAPPPPQIHKDSKVVENGFAVNVIELKDMASKDTHGHGHSHGHGQGHSHGLHTSAASSASICGMKPVAFVVVVSDAMHNFADGLAIGAGFAKSLSAGLAVTIAVVCHELPHEVGDFAILLNTGMSLKKALFLNFVSALTCFGGLYPGIMAGQQEELRQWIFAVVAGGFLYVALVHMLRELREYGSLPWYLSIALQNLGLILGFVIILILAIYEDRLGGED